MSDLGRKQALAAGKCISSFGITFDAIYTSVLKRSVETYKLLVKTMPMQKPGTHPLYSFSFLLSFQTAH